MMPLPSAFTFSMKRSKFFENSVPSAKDDTARRVTSWAAAVDAARTTATPAMNVERIFLSSGMNREPVGGIFLIYSFEYNQGGGHSSQLRPGVPAHLRVEQAWQNAR